MKRTFLSPADPFSALPLLSVLPVRGDAARLAVLSSSLYARYEKVQRQLRDTDRSARDADRRLTAEEGMLKQVLEWVRQLPEGE